MSEQLHSINEVLQDLKTGKPVIIVDDESRENEGDLIIAAEFATQENINFMVKYARGIVCTPMRREALEKLGIPAIFFGHTFLLKIHSLFSAFSSSFCSFFFVFGFLCG